MINNIGFNSWQNWDIEIAGKLADARRQLHFASQFIAAVGKCYLTHQPDDSHTNMCWEIQHSALVGRMLQGGEQCKFGISPSKFALLKISAAGDVTDAFTLSGKTMVQAENWVKQSLNVSGYHPDQFSRKMHYEIEPHAVDGGAPFSDDILAETTELGKYWGNAHLLISEINTHHPGASEVRCWPHHFDIALLITLNPNASPEQVKTIGVGLSPGDANYPLPYFYISPWPYPENTELLPAVSGNGFWHTNGWVGAVLTADKFPTDENVQSQIKQLQQFIRSGIAASDQLLSAKK